jgi:hypothetical protein
MSISTIGASQAAALSAVPTTPNLVVSTGTASGSDDGALTTNVDLAASGVSSALQDLSSALGSIINTTA